MMAITHSVVALAIGSLALQTSDTTTIALLIAGSQLPDIDNTQSTVGRMIWPLARFIEERWPHRSITHSFWATVAIAIASFLAAEKFGFNWLALPFGHFVAICTDSLTPEGVQLFWPAPKWAVCGSNPNARIATGSKGEITLLAFFACLLAFSLWSMDAGGIRLWINQLIGNKDSLQQTISTSEGNRHIYAEIEGNWISDRQPIKQKFWVVKQEGLEFVIADAKGIYKTGIAGQISTKRLVPKPGEPAQYQIVGVDFSEEEINPKLQQLIKANSLIFLTGTLTIDSPEEVRVSLDPKQLQTITIVGNTIQMESCPVQWVIEKLNYQFGTGSLKAQIVSPPPKLL